MNTILNNSGGKNFLIKDGEILDKRLILPSGLVKSSNFITNTTSGTTYWNFDIPELEKYSTLVALVTCTGSVASGTQFQIIRYLNGSVWRSAALFFQANRTDISAWIGLNFADAQENTTEGLAFNGNGYGLRLYHLWYEKSLSTAIE